MAVEDVARAFNVPPHMLGLPGTNTYSSVEANNLAWVTHCLRPLVQKIETALQPLMRRYPGGENAYIQFNMNGLLRADTAARMSAYSVGLQSGFLAINDVRRLEDLSPIDDVAVTAGAYWVADKTGVMQRVVALLETISPSILLLYVQRNLRGFLPLLGHQLTVLVQQVSL